MSKRTYPRVDAIRKVKPQGRCGLCHKIELNGHRPDKIVIIQYTYMRGDDDVVKAHSECITAAGDGLLQKLMTGKSD